MTVKERLWRLLDDRELTLYKVGKESGVSMTTIYNIKTRGTVPNYETLYKICNLLEISLSDFFDFDEKELHPNDRESYLIEMYRTLESNGQERLMGYLEGLKS